MPDKFKKPAVSAITVVDLDFSHGRAAARDPKVEQPRFACERIVRVLFCDSPAGGRFQSAVITSCWASGLAMRMPLPVRVGGQVFLEMFASPERLVIYTVTSCAAWSPGGHEVELTIGGAGPSAASGGDASEVLRWLIDQ